MPALRRMPLAARAELMVRRGEARDFFAACSILSRRRRRSRVVATRATGPAYRLPYADN